MAQELTNEELLALAGAVLEIEARAVDGLRARLDDAFVAACRLCLDTRGRIVVTGMGKSGHISGKIAATLASTGTPAFFMAAIADTLSPIRRITSELGPIKVKPTDE